MSGENAFAHEAGIHQDGYLKESTYEIIEPSECGCARKQSGARQAQRPSRFEGPGAKFGLELTREELDEVYTRFTHLADNKKGFRNDEIVALIKSVKGQSVPAGASK